MLDFERLEAYKKAITFTDWAYEITIDFPKSEQFAIVSQLRRAALSIPLNIAEGSGRYNIKERKHYYRMAKSSTYECIPLLEISKLQKYIDEGVYEIGRKQSIELTKILSGLINSTGKNWSK